MRVYLLIFAFALCESRRDRHVTPADQLKVQLYNFVEELNVVKETSDVGLIKKFKDFETNYLEVFERELNAERDTLAVLDTIQLWRSVMKPIHKIQVVYNTFRRFYTQQTASNRLPSPEAVWISFAKSIVDDQNGSASIPNLFNNLEQFISKGTLFDVILKDLDASSICVSKQSPHQLLYNLYNTLAMTEMKGYSMIQFSYMVLKLHDKGNYTQESEIERDKYKERSVAMAAKMQEAMRKASRHLWRCDPKEYREGTNYLEITQLLQGYLQNEVDLNSEGTCRENCAAYQYTKSHSCYQNLYCRQQRRCQGKILNCRYVDSDMWVCPSNSTLKRRYEYIEYENGKIFGKKGPKCSKGRVEVESWWRWLFWHCSYCMCLCDEEGIFSDRYVSMKPAVSDVQQNKVVTGVRFVKENRIVHLQVEQGKLLPDGNVEKATVEWKPVDAFRLNDRGVSKDVDYFTLSWDNRAVDLDVLEGRDGHVLTGVQFHKIGGHLNFRIQITPFDYKTGELNEHLSEWVDNINTEFSNSNPRKVISFYDVDIPTLSQAPSQIRSTHNQYVEFTHTSFERDAAQTTVPFIDAQEVVSKVSINSGAGIYYKSSGDRSGGFIGLKLVTLDHSNYLLNENDFTGEPESN